LRFLISSLKGINSKAQGRAAHPHGHQVKKELIFQKTGSPFRIAC
jgi:hypothetical protein